ncbi:serine protease [Streptomyces lavendulae]|uniref:serine protease n=1 Tax=Streptomyces lavendulae TaxID=1914 RepID=UPI0025569E83|nr:serine protease [Streptomyces lavendulae]
MTLWKLSTTHRSRWGGLLSTALALGAALLTLTTAPSAQAIAGGSPARPEQFPSMLGLQLDGEHWCGATLIKPGWAVTAAHCLFKVDTSKLTVTGGLLDINPQSVPSANNARVTQAVSHPDFDMTTLRNDIALLKLTGTPSGAAPVGLPPDSANVTFQGSPAMIAGWGTSAFMGRPSYQLMYADVTVLGNSDCQAKLPNDVIDTTRLCTYGLKKSACQYDGGGPVYSYNTVQKRNLLIGIISAGGSGCGGHEPDFNTRVSSFLGWIASVTA